MARKPRIHYPTAFYHVILRGNGRQDIFFDEQDRYRFYLLMQEGIERYRHRVHAFCLMTNHIHLLIQVADVPLSRIMQNLTFRYTRWVNWRQKRSGHLFQGRYKAVLADADSYLLELVRYLHLNPVRSGMADDPLQYTWSSHRAYCGKDDLPWLSTELTLSYFGARQKVALKNFQAFVLEGVSEGNRPEFHGSGRDSRVLGDDSFAEKILANIDDEPVQRISIDKIVSAVCAFYGIQPDELKDRTHRAARLRGITAWLALETDGCTITELSVLTGRDVSTLSTQASRVREQAKCDANLAWEFTKIALNTKTKA